MGKQSAQHLEFKGQERQQQKEDMADNNSSNSENLVEEIKRKNSSTENSSTLKSVKSASINVIKKGIKIVNVTNKEKKAKESKPSYLSPDMFDYSKGEASTLGFEPLAAQTEKPEITIVRLSDYTQVSHHLHPKETTEDHVEVPSSTQGRALFAETRSAFLLSNFHTMAKLKILFKNDHLLCENSNYDSEVHFGSKIHFGSKFHFWINTSH